MTTMLDRPATDTKVTSEQLLAIVAKTKTPTVPTVSSGHRLPRGVTKNNPTSRAWSMGGDVD